MKEIPLIVILSMMIGKTSLVNTNLYIPHTGWISHGKETEHLVTGSI